MAEDVHVANGPDSEPARLYADWAMTSHQMGDSNRSHDLMEKMMSIADPEDHAIMARGRNLMGLLNRQDGRLEDALRDSQASLEIAEQAGNFAAQVAALNNLALIQQELGKSIEGVQLLRLAIERCAEIGDRHRDAALRNNLADLLHAAGDEEGAMEQLKSAVTTLAEIAGDLTPETADPGVWMLSEW